MMRCGPSIFDLPGLTFPRKPLTRHWSAAAFAAILAGGAFGGTANASFVPPSAWQAQSDTPSQDVLTHRTALIGGIGSAIAESSQLTKEESWALSIFYQSSEFSLAWIDEAMPSEASAKITRVLAEADTHALNADDYADAVKKMAAIGPASSLGDRVEADVALSRAVLLYARHASAGRVKPRSLSKNNAIYPVAADPAETLARLVAADGPGNALESFNPQSEDYKALRQAFIALSASSGGREPTKVPAGRTLKPGMSDSRVVVLRQRLVETDDLDTVEAQAPRLFDEMLTFAVEAFQTKKGLPADGVVGPMTLAALNHTTGDQLKKLMVNMERRRWRPDDLGAKYVFVNQPDFKLNVVDDNQIIHTARVVIGKRKFQSPAFSDEMETVVFNPYWNVPASITKNEYMPLVRQDPTIMARKGFQAFASNGRRFVPVDLNRINWSDPESSRLKIRLRQPPGRSNALGRVKFLFPNEHAVYLHDTPSKSLFKRASRAYSHGCIRVQDPLAFAEVILQTQGWSRKDIDRAVARGTNQHIKLKTKVPVHLVYWTAFADENGQVQYRDDIYGRDDQLADALGFDDHALKMAQLADN